MPRLSPARTVCFTALLVIALFSLKPFRVPSEDPKRAARITRGFDLSREAVGPWTDFIPHVCVFLFVGAGACGWSRRPGLRSLLMWALLLSVPAGFLIEAGQLFLPSRHAHLADLAAHVTGALIGAGLTWRFRKTVAGLGVLYARYEGIFYRMVLAVAAIALLVLLVVPALWGMSLASWDRSYRLLIGNEVGGARTWLGDIRYVAFYDRALTPHEVERRFAARGAAQTTNRGVVDGLLTEYDFTTGSGPTVRAHGPIETPWLVVADPGAVEWLPGRAGLRLRRSTVLSTRVPPRAVTDAVVATGAFSVEVWCRPANLSQGGPARIVSVSDGPSRRNFTLGQERADLTFRVRNFVAGENGSDPSLWIRNPGLTTTMHHLLATHERGLSRLFVDGEAQPHTLDLHTPAAVFSFGDAPGGHLAAAVLYLLPFVLAGHVVPARARRWMRPLLTGGAVLVLFGAGWLIRYAATGDGPDTGTAGWAVLVLAVLYPTAGILCGSTPPASSCGGGDTSRP